MQFKKGHIMRFSLYTTVKSWTLVPNTISRGYATSVCLGMLNKPIRGRYSQQVTGGIHVRVHLTSNGRVE